MTFLADLIKISQITDGAQTGYLVAPEYSIFYCITSSYYKIIFNNYESEELSHSLVKKQSLYPILEHILLSFDPTCVFVYGNY
jgi:hypothetical protein